MARLWEPEAKFRIWLDIETYAAEGMAALGLVPKKAAKPCASAAASTSPASTPSSGR